jgi:hypothetical protein
MSYDEKYNLLEKLVNSLHERDSSLGKSGKQHN